MPTLPLAQVPEPSLELVPTFPAWFPTDRWVRLALVPVLTFVALAANTSYLADFWHHLARGRVIASEGRLLDHDIFTFTVAGASFQDVNWLSQVFYFDLFDVGGLPLVQVVNALVMALALGLFVAHCGRLAGSASIGMFVGIAAFLGLWQVLTIRPQTFSLFLFALVLDLLERSQRRPRLLLFPPLLAMLWANLHGAFPAGLMLVGCSWAAAVIRAWRNGQLLGDRRAWQLAACLAACVLATLANPYGWRIYLYVGVTSNRAAARAIDEWVPPSFDQAIGIAFFVSIILLAILTALAYRRGWRPSICNVILAVCFFVLAAGSVRMVAWWLLAIGPLAAVLLSRLMSIKPQDESKPTLGAGLTFAALLHLALFSVPGLATFNPLLAMRSQARVEHDLDRVLERLQDQGATRVFTRFEWGEYISWAADGRVPVFMDGRIEIYPDEVWRDYEGVTVGRGWSKILDNYKVDALILDSDYHARTGLLPLVRAGHGWVQVFEARTAILFLRKGAEDTVP